MQKLRLTKPVTVEGLDIFGRRAWLRFGPLTPGVAINSYGWWWQYKQDQVPVPVTTDIMVCHPRLLSLGYNGYKLHIYEHIGALRWTGLNGVVISGSQWPPYFGRIDEYWQVLKPYCQPDVTNEVPLWTSLDHEVKFGDKSRCLTFSPANVDGLLFQIDVNFKGLGVSSTGGKLALEDVEKAFKAHTLGWPKQLYRLSQLGSLIGLWRHHKNVAWPQDYSPDKILQEIIYHRLGDLLGTLSLISRQSLIAGHIHSHCAGHQHDLMVVSKLNHLSQ